MRLTHRFVLAGLTCALLVLVAAGRARGSSLEVVASDARGVTLRLDAAALELTPPGPDGRSRVTIPGLESAGETGRPALPYAGTLIGLPPGARATARVMDAGPDDVRPGLKLAVGGKPGFRSDGGALGLIAVADPAPAIADGPWPTAAVELGAPFTVRRQRVVALRVHPVRYDEASGTVWSRRSLTVRVEFQGALEPRATGIPVGEDPHWDSVLEQAVINFDAARAWRSPLTRTTAPALQMVRQTSRLGARSPVGTLGTAAFDEDNREVRCQIDTTGVFAFTFPNLSAKGFPTDIPISQLSVHRHEFIAGANPPYVTIELPIEVDDRNADPRMG